MNIKEANGILFERYINILRNSNYKTDIEECSKEHLIYMCDYAVKNILDFPDDKTSRWLWYIQWIMINNKLISVNEERDFSRKLFHKVYEKNLIKIPKSIDLKNNYKKLWK